MTLEVELHWKMCETWLEIWNVRKYFFLKKTQREGLRRKYTFIKDMDIFKNMHNMCML